MTPTLLTIAGFALLVGAVSAGVTFSGELTILTLAASGLTNAEIADQLDMGLRTVELRLSECRKALGFTRERQLIAWAGRNLA